jgi:hypothetical protein
LIWAGHRCGSFLDFLLPFKSTSLWLANLNPLTWFWLDNCCPARAAAFTLFRSVAARRERASSRAAGVGTLAYVCILWGMIC